MTSADDAIVVGVDGSEQATRALRWAAGEAALRNLRLHVVFAFAPPGGVCGAGLSVPRQVYADFVHAGHELLRDAAETAHAVAGDVVVTSEMPNELPSPMLIELSRTARTVVVGASGSGGFAGMLAGSTAVAVAGHAHCPVLVVRGREMDAASPVVAGVDGSPDSESALGVAFEEASWRNVPLVAVHAWRDTGDEPWRMLAECLAGWAEKYPDVPVDRVVARDRPRQQLLHWTEQAQLIVIGSRGRGGFPGLMLGSVGHALVHHAQCPLLIVRPRIA
ncbi:universal stress protein [Amycolatopsis pithecellobii]|uniref:Universal stress protein n=1 Tax=Amycolatopsis pithecellobii TaxID=664692 RepID=A0A6N7YRR9_9PSEU|nr:universal stress protein [Amycolatopsis pithecellobii]MTD54618.1 universal stress protein [Amycolatopsis pithecellobii]